MYGISENISGTAKLDFPPPNSTTRANLNCLTMKMKTLPSTFKTQVSSPQGCCKEMLKSMWMAAVCKTAQV